MTRTADTARHGIEDSMNDRLSLHGCMAYWRETLPACSALLRQITTDSISTQCHLSCLIPETYGNIGVTAAVTLQEVGAWEEATCSSQTIPTLLILSSCETRRRSMTTWHTAGGS